MVCMVEYNNTLHSNPFSMLRTYNGNHSGVLNGSSEPMKKGTIELSLFCIFKKERR